MTDVCCCPQFAAFLDCCHCDVKLAPVAPLTSESLAHWRVAGVRLDGTGIASSSSSGALVTKLHAEEKAGPQFDSSVPEVPVVGQKRARFADEGAGEHRCESAGSGDGPERRKVQRALASHGVANAPADEGGVSDVSPPDALVSGGKGAERAAAAERAPVGSSSSGSNSRSSAPSHSSGGASSTPAAAVAKPAAAAKVPLVTAKDRLGRTGVVAVGAVAGAGTGTSAGAAAGVSSTLARFGIKAPAAPSVAAATSAAAKAGKAVTAAALGAGIYGAANASSRTVAHEREPGRGRGHGRGRGRGGGGGAAAPAAAAVVAVMRSAGSTAPPGGGHRGSSSTTAAVPTKTSSSTR